jgi:NAD(P)H-dependent FMN reductase
MNGWLHGLSVTALVGSRHQNSISKAAAECALSLIIEDGIKVDIAILADYFCTGSAENKTTPMEAYVLTQKVQQASALICVAPEVDGSYDPLMKQGLQLLRPEDVRGKPVGCIGLGNGVAGGARAMASLMEDMRSLGAGPLAYGVFISPSAVIMSRNGFEAFSRTIFQQLRMLGNDVVFSALREYRAA